MTLSVSSTGRGSPAKQRSHPRLALLNQTTSATPKGELRRVPTTPSLPNNRFPTLGSSFASHSGRQNLGPLPAALAPSRPLRASRPPAGHASGPLATPAPASPRPPATAVTFFLRHAAGGGRGNAAAEPCGVLERLARPSASLPAASPRPSSAAPGPLAAAAPPLPDPPPSGVAANCVPPAAREPQCWERSAAGALR